MGRPKKEVEEGVSEEVEEVEEVAEETPEEVVEEVAEDTSSEDCILEDNESIQVINGKKYILVNDGITSYHKKDEDGIEITL